MRGKKSLFPLFMAFLMIGSIFVIVFSVPPYEPEENKPEFDISGKSVLIIIPQADFNDIEFFTMLKYVRNCSGNATVASDFLATATGLDGGTYYPNITLADVNASQYDAIVFIGGPGMEAHFNDSVMFSIAENASEQNKLVGAICIAPCMLANAGVLNGQKATVFNNQTYIDILTSNGATYVDQEVVRYGNFVTASGPDASYGFARKIMELLSGE